jgi:hypothetical protein
MDHRVDPPNRLADASLVGEVRLEQFDTAASSPRASPVGAFAQGKEFGRRVLSAVEGADRIAAGGEGRAEVAADEARGAGDEDEPGRGRHR